MQKNNKAIVGILFLVMVFFIILMVFAGFTLKSLSFGDSDEAGDMFGDKIGVVKIEGVIMESEKIIELLHKAEKDNSVKAIILRINSPGGAVGPTQEIYDEVIRIDNAYSESLKEKTKEETDNELIVKELDSFEPKPVYVSFGAIAASGGYYIGAAGRKIYSNAGTITGSIGVIMQFLDLSKVYEFAKVTQETIKAGRYKDAGNPARALKDVERGMLNTMVDGVHKQFIKDILAKRKKIIKGDIWEHAQGQIFSGEQALKLGLVDKLGGIWPLARDIHKEMKLSGTRPSLKEIKKKKKKNFLEIMEGLDSVSSLLKNFKILIDNRINLLAK